MPQIATARSKTTFRLRSRQIGRAGQALLFIIMLAHIAASIFLFKKNKKNFNNFKNESEQAIKRIENKTDAIYSQVYRLRNQQFENYGK